MATFFQNNPVALVPINDPMTLVNNQQNLGKVNNFRSGCDQTLAGSVSQASGTTYCSNLYYTAPSRLSLNSVSFSKIVSPNPSIGNSLYSFLCARFANTFGPNGLNCTGLLNVNDPVMPILTNNVATGCTIVVPTSPPTSQFSSASPATSVLTSNHGSTASNQIATTQSKSLLSRITANIFFVFIFVMIAMELNI